MVQAQFAAFAASTGTNRMKFTLVWASGEEPAADKWGWQLTPSVGAIASTNSVFVTPSIKPIQTNGNPVPIAPDVWRKSQAWLDYSFMVARSSRPAFVIVGSFDDIAERNAWMGCDTTRCTNGLQMHDITGTINPTNFCTRVRQWISGSPSSNPGGVIPDGCYVVTNNHSHQSLNLPNSIGTNYGYAGLPLAQSIPGTNLDNYFMLYHLGANVYRLISLDSGLAVQASGNTPGAPISQAWDGPGFAQRWQVVSASNGCYYIQNLASGLALDVGGAMASGAAVVQNNLVLGAASQQWGFGLVAGIEPPNPPRLTVLKTAQGVQLNWPTNYTTYTLQRQPGSPGLSSFPAAWLDVLGVVSNAYTEPTTSGSGYFRLKSQ